MKEIIGSFMLVKTIPNSDVTKNYSLKAFGFFGGT